MADKLRKATVAAFEVNQNEGNISGLKTWIGVALLVAAGQLDVVNDIALNFPDFGWVDSLRAILEQVISWLEFALEVLGSGFLGVGLLDKVRKFLSGVFG